MNKKEKNLQIKGYEITNDNLTSRSGLNFFVKYLEEIGIYKLFLEYYGTKGFKKNKKGYNLKKIFKQLILYFVDGTYNQISGFDELKKDTGYSSIIETEEKEMCSSSAIRRFFNKFTFNLNHLYEKILIELFVWRLKIEKPKIIELFVDTCVLKNESCRKREGVSWTYKKTMGYQPLNIIWNGLPILSVLKNGSNHALSDDTTETKIKTIVRIIKKRYSSEIPILIKMDTGFLCQSLFKSLDKLNVYFISVCRWDENTKLAAKNMTETLSLKEYKNKNNDYEYCEFGYKYKSWDKHYRVIYLELKNKEDQLCLEGFRDKTLLITNLKQKSGEKYSEELLEYFNPKKIIELNHLRGNDELTHRGIKDFGTEKLPLQKFNQNAAFYYTMIISYFLFECFKKDILYKTKIIKVNSYATTIRRKVIDIAGKIIKTGGKIILKLTKSAYEFLNPEKILLQITNSVRIMI